MFVILFITIVYRNFMLPDDMNFLLNIFYLTEKNIF